MLNKISIYRNSISALYGLLLIALVTSIFMYYRVIRLYDAPHEIKMLCMDKFQNMRFIDNLKAYKANYRVDSEAVNRSSEKTKKKKTAPKT